MKNTLISFATLFILLFFVFIGDTNLNSLCDNSLKVSQEIQIALDNNNWDDALEKSVELKKIMSNGFKKVSVYVNHQDIDTLNTETVKLIDFIKVRDLSNSLSSLDSTKCLAEYIKELQQINLTNIL